MREPGPPESALELRDAVRRGEVRPSELVERALEGIAARPELGAFISVTAELARAEAAGADRLFDGTPRDARDSLPPLFGLPTAHKDLVRVRGSVTTYGTAALPHSVADSDDAIAASVREAGAISVGKTQVPEFGIAGYSENEIAPAARNPYDLSLTAGGSSGGTAAAVAAGLVPAAIASDAGGSIRIPSAACGLIGLKPGRGRIPADRLTSPGELDEWGAPRMGVSGPIARDARDAALMFDAIAGPSGAGQRSALEAVERSPELRGLRIGVSLASPFDSWIDVCFAPEALAALDVAIARLGAAGHLVEEATFHYDPDYPEAFRAVWTQALRRIDFGAGAKTRLGALSAAFLEHARAVPAEHIDARAAALRRFAADAARQWGAYDIVLTPALAGSPPRVGAFHELGPEGDYRLQCEWAPQTSMVNVAGLPALTAPTHFTAPSLTQPDGIPFGVQLIGRSGSETQLLQLAAQLSE